MREDHFSDPIVHMHLEEAEIMKKQWFSYVFETLNRLHEQIAETSRQSQKDRDKIHQELIKLKEDLLLDLKANAAISSKELEKLETRLQCIIRAVERQLNVFCKEDFKCLDNKVDELSIKQTAIGTKLTAYIAMITIGVTSLLGVMATGVLMVFKDAIKAWIGA